MEYQSRTKESKFVRPATEESCFVMISKKKSEENLKTKSWNSLISLSYEMEILLIVWINDETWVWDLGGNYAKIRRRRIYRQSSVWE